MAGCTPLTDAQEQAVIAALPQFSLRDAALILSSLYLGFRITETLSLNADHLWEAGRVKAQVRIERRRLKGGKGRHRKSITSRTLPIHPFLAATLERFLFARFGSGDAPPGEPLFVSRTRHGRLSRWRANVIVHQVLRAAGIESENFYGTHSLRKAFCRKTYQAANFDINLTRQIMGHANIATTQMYLEVDDAAVRACVLRLGNPPAVVAGVAPAGPSSEVAAKIGGRKC